MKRGSAAVALISLALLQAACLDGPTDVRGPDDTVRIFFAGEELADSIQARLPGVLFRVVERDTEDVPVPNLRVIFNAAGEDCGTPAEPIIISDDEGYVGNVWNLGGTEGTCRMDVRVVNASGIQLGVSSAEAEVLPGQADLLLALEPGQTVEGMGSLALTSGEEAAFDRLGNEVGWGFRVISGPVSAVGGTFGSEGARTLVASGGTGSGQVAFETQWGDFAIAELCVTSDAGGTRIRLDRPAPGVTIPPCPA